VALTRLSDTDLSGVVTQVALKFTVGPPFKRFKKFVVSDARVKPGSRVFVTRTYDPTFDILNLGEDELEMDQFDFAAVPFTGGFNLYVTSTGPVWGWVSVQYLLGENA
jgi:hypothetical protein